MESYRRDNDGVARASLESFGFLAGKVNNCRSLKVIRMCLAILTLFAVTMALIKLQAVLIPLTIAIVLHFMLLPVTDFFSNRLKLPKWAAISVSLAISLGFLVSIATALTLAVGQFSENVESYREKIEKLIGNSVLFNYLNVDLLTSIDSSEFFNVASIISRQAFGVLGTFFLVSIFLLFFMVSKYKSVHKKGLFAKVRKNISTYIWIKTIVSAVTAAVVGFFLHFIGLELALTFTLLTFLLNFIPSLGSLIATLAPLPVAYLQFGSGMEFILILLVPSFIEVIIGNVIEPKFMGDSFGLHPIAILFSLLFWSIVWGPVGAFLAVPITSILKLVFKDINELKFIASLLEGRLPEKILESESD